MSRTDLTYPVLLRLTLAEKRSFLGSGVRILDSKLWTNCATPRPRAGRRLPANCGRDFSVNCAVTSLTSRAVRSAAIGRPGAFGGRERRASGVSRKHLSINAFSLRRHADCTPEFVAKAAAPRPLSATNLEAKLSDDANSETSRRIVSGTFAFGEASGTLIAKPRFPCSPLAEGRGDDGTSTGYWERRKNTSERGTPFP